MLAVLNDVLNSPLPLLLRQRNMLAGMRCQIHSYLFPTCIRDDACVGAKPRKDDRGKSRCGR